MPHGGRDSLGALDRAWDDAWRSTRDHTIFQSSGWYHAWLVTVGRHVEPIVLRVPNRDGSLVGLALQWDASTSTISPLSSPWADYHDVVGAMDDLACSRLADALAGLATGNARLELTEVRPGSALARVATTAGLRAAPGTPTRAVDLRNAATVGRILDRREHVAKMRRLQRLGDVRLTHHTPGPAMQERLGRFVAMHRAQWAGRTDAVAPFDGDGGVVERFFQELTASCPGTLISELTVDREPVAMRFGFLWGRTCAGYRPAFDATRRALSPGQLLLRAMVEDLVRRELHCLDLMRGDHPYKARFADVHRQSLTFAHA